MAPSDIERPLPASLDAERGILGAILLDNGGLRLAADKLHAGDFFSDHHQKIFSAMLKASDHGTAIDLLTISDVLRNEGQLEAAGGAAYLSALIDGVPRVSNLEHYCKIVHEKAELRRIVHKCHSVEAHALGSGIVNSTELFDELEVFVRAATSQNGHRQHMIVSDFRQFVMKDFGPREHVTAPILPVKGTLELHAWRGLGKTYLMWEWAYCVAVGPPRIPKFLAWDIPKPRRVLYVDGEMDALELQERMQELSRGHDLQVPEPGFLILCTPDEQPDGNPPNIGTVDGQRRVEEKLQEGTFLLLDSLSTLLRKAKEDDEAWFAVQDWLLRLRRKGITVGFLHHSGKSGAQRGTSKREDFLNTVITLKRPSDYQEKEGMRVELHFEKSRGAKGAAVLPLEVKLETRSDGAQVLAWRTLKNTVMVRAIEMFKDGQSDSAVGEELHISRWAARRLRKKWETAGDAAAAEVD